MNERAPEIATNAEVLDTLNLSEADKAMLAEGMEINAELRPYAYQEVDTETNAWINEGQTKVYQIMMNPNLNGPTLLKAGLPWDPYFERIKQQKLAANEKTAPRSNESAVMPEEAPDWYQNLVGYNPQRSHDGARVDQEQHAA